SRPLQSRSSRLLLSFDAAAFPSYLSSARQHILPILSPPNPSLAAATASYNTKTMRRRFAGFSWAAASPCTLQAFAGASQRRRRRRPHPRRDLSTRRLHLQSRTRCATSAAPRSRTADLHDGFFAMLVSLVDTHGSYFLRPADAHGSFFAALVSLAALRREDPTRPVSPARMLRRSSRDRVRGACLGSQAANYAARRPPYGRRRSHRRGYRRGLGLHRGLLRRLVPLRRRRHGEPRASRSRP
ncbi:unnamed protein product, partial [Urochloa humidicola]